MEEGCSSSIEAILIAVLELAICVTDQALNYARCTSRSGLQFRSRKKVEKFIKTGEAQRNKPKPETKESHVLPSLSQSSEPTPGSNMAWPPIVEFYSEHLHSFMSPTVGL
ncbi:hypothetical protein AAC387_Pa03g1814 [Persea americana]